MSDDRIKGFLHRYSPEVEEQLRAARAELRARLERGYELVFDGYNALVFAISPTTSSTNCFLSVAGYPRWVTLFFAEGTTLVDPLGLLTGTGKSIRSVRLTDPSVFASAGVQDLVDQAVARHADSLAQAPPLSTLVKTEVAKQRSRRP